MEVGFRIEPWVNQTLVFVAPDDQVEEFGEEVFGKIVGL